jgi:NAD(P) transhydrogenase subunit beta
MPILDVDKAAQVIVIKRSMSPGFAGIPNELFVAPNCAMLFGDGKQVAEQLIETLSL